jgi:hypothetical protein
MLVIQNCWFQYHRVLVIIIIIFIQFLDLHKYFGVQWNESQKELRYVFSNLGGLDLSQRGLDRDSQSQHRQRVSLDPQP